MGGTGACLLEVLVGGKGYGWPCLRGIVISGLSVEGRIPVLPPHCGPANAIAIERIRATRISVFVWCASRNLHQSLVKYDLCYLKSSLAKLSTYANGVRCIRSPPPSLVGGGRFVWILNI